MGFLDDNCILTTYSNEIIENSEPFDCGSDDLNEFFQEDCIPFSNELLGKTYCFHLNEDSSVIVCAFTIANDSLKTSHLTTGRKKMVNKNIPKVKQFRSYPAVLIGRLGVGIDFRKKDIGSDVLKFIKIWFREPKNKTGCRFLIVDAYNTERVLEFYANNGFELLFTSEEQEKTFYKINGDSPLNTRLMLFDLITLNTQGGNP